MFRIVLISFLLFGFAATNYAQTIDGKVYPVMKYYEFVNLAEKSIIEDDLKAAKWHYEAASFYTYVVPEPKDLYNAFVVNYKLKEYKIALYNFKRLLDIGYAISTLDSMDYMMSIANEPAYKDSIRAKAILNVDQFKRQNIAYANFVDTLFYYDQLYREYRDTFSYDVDSMVQSDLLNFTDSFKFPGVTVTGPTSNSGRFIGSPTAAFYLVWHTRGDSTIFHTKLKNAVWKGEYSPDDYAFVMDHYKNRYHQMPLKPISQFTNSELKVINDYRSQIFLDDLAEHYQKIDFQASNKDYIFFNWVVFRFLDSRKYNEIYAEQMKY